MRVLVATHTSLEVGSGEERTLEDVARRLAERGHEVRFANYAGLHENERRFTLAEVRERLGGVTLVPVQPMPLLGRVLAIPSLGGLKVLVESFRWADVVLFGQFYGYDLTLSVLAKALDRPLVCSQANALFRRHRSLVRDAVQEGYERTVGVPLLRRFAGVRVCNTTDLEFLRGIGCSRVTLLYPPNTDFSRAAGSDDLSDVQRDRLERLSKDRRFKFLLAGRMTHQKGLDLLADALVRLGRERPALPTEFVFLLAGTTQLPIPLRAVAARFPQLIENFGVLSPSALAAVMSQVDATLMPSRYESFGRVAAESLSLGKPVLGTDIPGLREVVTSGVTGILVDGWSAETLGSAILHFRDLRELHPDEWKAMGSAARARFLERFDDRTVHRQMDELLSTLEQLANPPS
ncbi:MAG TPA: glycosyltransferase family 4 protein [Thermoplasmata archaeon]|nr:glycosyltransferase family 4 protein [Thermoplasmata archaeon]